MEENKARLMEKIQPDLLVPPHVLGTLARLVLGEWQPAPSQREQLIAHLTACSYCRTTLIVLLSAEQKYQKSNGSPDEAEVNELLAQFETIHREIEVSGYEQMGTYAEAIATQGKEEADQHFPVLAQHIKRCPACSSFLEDLLAFLNETAE